MNYTQISDRLPSFFLATDDYTYGSYRCRKSVGIQRSIIQNNPKDFYFRMVFDIDHPVEPTTFAEEHDVVEPSWIAVNPQNEHAHVAYELGVPIHLYDGHLYKPLNWATKIQYGLANRFKADKSYSEKLMKNPCHIRWDVTFNDRGPFSLAEIAQHLKPHEMPRAITRKVAEESWLGRNCHLFYTLRQWAYKAIRDFWGGTFEKWRSMCKYHAEACNDYMTPLPLSEVKSCAYSVAKWVWNNFNARRLREILHERSVRSNEKRWAPSRQQREDMQVSARLMRAKGMSYRMIEEVLGVGKSTIQRWFPEGAENT